MDMNEKNIKEIISRLDVLVRLSAASLIEGKSATEQIKILAKAGLQPKDIANITGKTPNNVRVTLSLLKAGKREKKKDNK